MQVVELENPVSMDALGRVDWKASSAGQLLEAQRHVLEMIVRGHPLSEILGALCGIVEDLAPGAVKAAILLVDSSGRHLYTGAAPALPDAYSRAVDGIAIDPNVGTCAAAAARRCIVITPDIESDPAWNGLSHLPLGEGLRAAWSMPIMSAAGTVLGTFGTYFVERRGPHEQERQLVEVLARTAALAIERLRVTRTLEDSEARYRAMVQASPECVKLVAADGTLLQINAAGLRMVEAATAGDVIGASVYDLIAPEHRERFRAFNEFVCGGEGGALQFEIVGLQRTRRFMETNAVPLPVEGGGFVQLAVTRDITTRIVAERALARNRARLDYAVRLSGVGFWYCDLPFDELIWDAHVRQHFFVPDDMRVDIELFYERILPDDRDATRAAIDNSIRDNTSYDTVYRTVDPLTGAIKWIHAIGGTTYDPAGKPIRFDGVTVDITAQKMDQERLAHLLDSEREQVRRKDEFLATLAHELRNPLAPVRTGLEVLRVCNEPERLSKVREMMERQLGHLVRMVDDLLDISRVTLGKVQLKQERIDFRAILHSALETTRPLIEAAGHELAVRLPQDPFPLDADPTRLAQVVANLVNNSAKYTPPGGRIQITAETVDGELVVRVSDTGVGIPRDMLPRVFDMFTQVGRSIERSQGGLGIGLTLVRTLLAMHGGSVEAASAGLGCGSTFTVRLPLASQPQDTQAGAQLDAGAAAEHTLRILIVDDNADAAASLAMLLDLSGHQTRLAHSGRAALPSVLEFQPDIVLLDIGLPDMNGYEVAKAIRASQLAKQPVLIALTGWGSEEDKRQAYASGFDRHLVKPVDPVRLEEMLTASVG